MGYIDYFWHLDDHKNGKIRTGNESLQVVGAWRAPRWCTGIAFLSVRCTIVDAYGLYTHIYIYIYYCFALFYSSTMNTHVTSLQ
jgi:hypothetical protein